MDLENKIFKGTTTIGIVCKEGLVLAADKRATAGYEVASREMEKVFPITESIVITVAGLVSDAQLISKLIKAEISLKRYRTDKESSVKEVANLLATIVYANIRKMSMVPGIVGFLIGGKDSSGYKLFEIGIDGSVTEDKKFISTGSGSSYALGVLEAQYKDGVTIEEGVKLAVRALNAALQRNVATGEGIDVYSVTEKGAKKVLAKTIDYRIQV